MRAYGRLGAIALACCGAAVTGCSNVNHGSARADEVASTPENADDEVPDENAPDQGAADADLPPETALPGEVPEDDLLDDTPNAEYLGTLTLDHVVVGDQLFLVWVADGFLERQRGLMYVTSEELEPLLDGRRRGMLFIWKWDNQTGFWMRNTITPLDVAFIREDGSIVTIHTMAPLDETIYPPDSPYRYALEVAAGTFDELGVGPGDLVELP